jgi:SAM-dependent methyltransferase
VIDLTVDRRVVCPCGGAVSMRDRMLDLEPSGRERGPMSYGQRLMEWRPLVRIYETRLWRRNPLLFAALGLSFERESEIVLRAAELSGQEAVLDIGCGSGIHSRRFARKLPRGVVVGLDRSVPMLERAGQKARATRADNLFFVHGSVYEMPFPDAEFDVVNCCAAMHFFTRLDRALGEIARVLRPGGRLTASFVRRPLGADGERAARRNERRFGVHAFAPGELERALRNAGLGDVVTYHAFSRWAVIGATKPLERVAWPVPEAAAA